MLILGRLQRGDEGQDAIHDHDHNAGQDRQLGLKSQIFGSQSQGLQIELAISKPSSGGTETDGSLLFSQAPRWEAHRRPQRAFVS